MKKQTIQNKPMGQIVLKCNVSELKIKFNLLWANAQSFFLFFEGAFALGGGGVCFFFVCFLCGWRCRSFLVHGLRCIFMLPTAVQFCQNSHKQPMLTNDDFDSQGSLAAATGCSDTSFCFEKKQIACFRL
jgi:hypothetical protein